MKIENLIWRSKKKEILLVWSVVNTCEIKLGNKNPLKKAPPEEFFLGRRSYNDDNYIKWTDKRKENLN